MRVAATGRLETSAPRPIENKAVKAAKAAALLRKRSRADLANVIRVEISEIRKEMSENRKEMEKFPDSDWKSNRV